MQLEIKFKSIPLRWFLNIFLIVAIVVCTVAGVSFAVYSNINTERVEDLASDYAYEFYALTGTNRATFKDTAISIAGEFEYKNKVEVQVIDRNGRVIVSTSGFPSSEQAMPDYTEAVETKATVTKKITTPDGEPIMASTTLIYDSDNNYLGAYRWITSLKATEKLIGNFVIMIALCLYSQ